MAGKNIVTLVVRFETRFHRRKNVSGGEFAGISRSRPQERGLRLRAGVPDHL